MEIGNEADAGTRIQLDGLAHILDSVSKAAPRRAKRIKNDHIPTFRRMGIWLRGRLTSGHLKPSGMKLHGDLKPSRIIDLICQLWSVVASAMLLWFVVTRAKTAFERHPWEFAFCSVALYGWFQAWHTKREREVRKLPRWTESNYGLVVKAAGYTLSSAPSAPQCIVRFWYAAHNAPSDDLSTLRHAASQGECDMAPTAYPSLITAINACESHIRTQTWPSVDVAISLRYREKDTYQ